MDENKSVCPVCTLYLRPGITLKAHLASHPKQKIIEALVALSNTENGQKFDNLNSVAGPSSSGTSQNTVIANHPANVENVTTGSPNSPGVHGNHLFIYQQSMSTTGSQSNVLNVNPLSQQYVIPAVFNSQMMPYVYQQQQVIMSSSACVPPPIHTLPFEVATASDRNNSVSNQKCTITEDTCESGNRLMSAEILSHTCGTLNPVETSKHLSDTIPNSEGKILVVHKEELHESIKVDNPTGTEADASFQQNDEYNEECLSSPGSQGSSEWSLKIRTDLNKACQTQSTNNLSPDPFTQEDEVLDDIENVEPEYYFPGGTEIPNATALDMNMQSYDHPTSVYATSNILQSNENLDFVEMDGMHVIINDFSTNHIISPVENFDNSKPERPGVLMTIGGMLDNSKDMISEHRDDSFSHDGTSVDIRADEHMPPRGELSGQESIGGASDITWNRIQYNEANSAMSSTYDLMGRETWETTDSSDIDVPPLLNSITSQDGCLENVPHTQNDDDVPAIVSFSGPPLNFKCSTCGEAFSCLKDRKQHEFEKHPDKKKPNVIGSEIVKKRVKKLMVKMKQDRAESETNFDNVFTNKLKLETSSEAEKREVTTPVEEAQEVKNEATPIDLKVVCSICEAVLPHSKALKYHKIQVHNVTPDVRHKCSSCGEAFPNDYKYTEHLKIHPLECRLCGKLFYRRQNIQLHMKRHLGIKPYKCEICEKSFLTKQKHDEHKNIHTGESPIKCSLCDETFKRYSNLLQHRNRHHFNFKKKVKDYICFCGDIFHTKKKLAWHKEIHDSKPKACTQCSEKFIHMSSLTRHMRRAHNERFLPKEERSSENVECPICKGVYLRSSLDVHMRNHSGQRPYACMICNKNFTTKWNLKLHKWTHASRTSKPFKCDQCKGAFIRETDYIAHINSHRSVRPYTCNYCGAQFIRKYNCQRHVREHENRKTFNCQECGKSFHRSYYLKDHMRVHSGARPYACHVCGKTSATKSNHNKHVQIHHAREPVNTEH